MVHIRVKYALTIVILLSSLVLSTIQAQQQETIIVTGEEFIKTVQSKDENKPLHITLQDGTYYDEVTIKSNTIIYGTRNPEFNGGVILDGYNIQIYNIKIIIIPPGSSVAILVKSSNNIALGNIKISGGPILINNSTNIAINNITIDNTRFPGITINNSENIIIEKYSYTGSMEYSIYVCNSKNILINSNVSIEMCEGQDPSQIKVSTKTQLTDTITKVGNRAAQTIGNDGSDETMTGNGSQNDINDGGKQGFKFALGIVLPIILTLTVALYRRKVRGR